MICKVKPEKRIYKSCLEMQAMCIIVDYLWLTKGCYIMKFIVNLFIKD